MDSMAPERDDVACEQVRVLTEIRDALRAWTSMQFHADEPWSNEYRSKIRKLIGEE